ncbi:Sorting nexin-16 [Linum grandiflorum]
MKSMETIEDLIEEAKVRTVWWALCIFTITYFLSHTSSSMWINLPISILIVAALRILSNEVEFYWKPRSYVRPQSYLSHLEKKQLSVNDSRLSSAAPPPRWRRKIDSPVVEASVNDFIDKIMKDFVVDLWYSEITPDKDAPELIRGVIMDALGEISGRVKEINVVDLLTRDILDLIGDHLDLFRRNQAAIGVDVMRTLSTEERDERLKHHLMESKELHPALISPESEYKVLQRIMSGVLAVVLRPREAQSPLVRTIAREIVTCLVMQPVLNLASPVYINEVIELILLAVIDNNPKYTGSDQATNSGASVSQKSSTLDPASVITPTKSRTHEDASMDDGVDYPDSPRHAAWGKMLEAATQRRTEVLTPENLENMWTKGRNYKKKDNKIATKAGSTQAKIKGSSMTNAEFALYMGKEMAASSTVVPTRTDGKVADHLMPQLSPDNSVVNEKRNEEHFIAGQSSEYSFGVDTADEFKSSKPFTNESGSKLKRSNSTSALKDQPEKKRALEGEQGGSVISEYYAADFVGQASDPDVKIIPDIVLRRDATNVPKLRSRVMGAYFEKLGSKSFAVYSIAVTDADQRTWFVKRRYSNFERLHRQLKDIPNYTLHLPPKRIFSSSTEDAFVHQRCIQLDKYLQDLLSIANVAEQHEVWDFLSAASKNYSFGRSSSVMKTLAVNVDDAVDDIMRQFKGVSGGWGRKVGGSASQFDESSSPRYNNNSNLSWNADDSTKPVCRQNTMGTENSSSDNDETQQQDIHDQEDAGPGAQAGGWHSDNEADSSTSPGRIVKQDEMSRSLNSKQNDDSVVKSDGSNEGRPSAVISSRGVEDPVGMPPEWTPPNVSVPLLNLVDKVFQLKRRGWLRRQVFWISKQIVQLMMEDAIDDWLLGQIYWLRREETIAFGIRWVQDFLWPNGTFFTKIGVPQCKSDEPQQNMNSFQLGQFGGSKGPKQSTFEEQLEASRRANYIRKTLFDGVPTALVSLIGAKQYRRCARDIYYFTQSTICIKQLAYAILELLLVTVFPELRDLLRELHEKMPVQNPA